MNFDEALTAHQLWKARLRSQLEGTAPVALEPEIVGQDDQCELGKWIHGKGIARLGKKPEFQEMMSSHAHFHAVASEVLRKAQDGDPEGAAQALRGDYFEASTKVVQAILKCKKVCH